MNSLSEQLESYKEAAIEHINSYWDFDYEYEVDNELIIVEQGVLSTDERVLFLFDVVDMLGKDKKKRSLFDDDDDIMIEYVKFGDMVEQLDHDELIALMLDKNAISEVEKKFDYSLDLQKKIENRLRRLSLYELHTFVDENPCMTINIPTKEVDFDVAADIRNNDNDVYDTSRFIARGCDINIPERNIFCGHQFQEAPILALSDEEYRELSDAWEEDSDGVSYDDLPF